MTILIGDDNGDEDDNNDGDGDKWQCYSMIMMFNDDDDDVFRWNRSKVRLILVTPSMTRGRREAPREE